MTDSLQSSSSIPLPVHQTLKGGQDPLPLSSPLELRKSAEGRKEADDGASLDAFKDYLDRTSVTVVERQQRKPQADTADMILQNSVYGQAGVSSPL